MSSAEIMAIIWFTQGYRPIASRQVEFNFILLTLNHTSACHKAVGARYSHHYIPLESDLASLAVKVKKKRGLVTGDSKSYVSFMNANMRKAMLQLHQ